MYNSDNAQVTWEPYPATLGPQPSPLPGFMKYGEVNETSQAAVKSIPKATPVVNVRKRFEGSSDAETPSLRSESICPALTNMLNVKIWG